MWPVGAGLERKIPAEIIWKIGRRKKFCQMFRGIPALLMESGGENEGEILQFRVGIVYVKKIFDCQNMTL